jgi:hypothetical protein
MDDFLKFVVERHLIWKERQAGMPPPWTDDPVLATHKFTNVFRILDPGTQFVMTDLADPELDPRDQLMRLFLYRHTGRIDTWEWLTVALGGYPTVGQFEEVRAAWKDYRRTTGLPFFTNAYLVFPQSQVPGTDKLDSIVDLGKRLFTPGSPDDVMPDWTKARTQAQRFKVLNRNKGVGNFMSMQVLTDWGYLQDVDREDEFLVPGPGSIKGAAALMPGVPTAKVVQEVVAAVRGLPQVPRLGYRVPSTMDIGSNLLCEWSKYVRFREKPAPSKIYKPAHPGPQPDPVLPAYYTEGEDLL